MIEGIKAARSNLSKNLIHFMGKKTLKEFSKELDISYHMLWNYISGGKYPRNENLRKICYKLKIKPNDLMNTLYK